MGLADTKWTEAGGDLRTRDLSLFATANFIFERELYPLLRMFNVSREVFFPAEDPGDAVSCGDVFLET